MNSEVTQKLINTKHNSINLINELRKLILESDARIDEIWKWNGPSYTCNSCDIITIRIFPENKPISVIFHAGVKPGSNIKLKINGVFKLKVAWKANDRAVFTVNSELDLISADLSDFICKWVEATS
ncbi:MAG: DUF1801 domain-containing protein [Bacteroidetes bacterium]|nr:DUF1801 domain-containing protein [Bacteroidota bacterium]